MKDKTGINVIIVDRWHENNRCSKNSHRILPFYMNKIFIIYIGSHSSTQKVDRQFTDIINK